MSNHIDNLDNLTPEAKRDLLAKMLAEKKSPASSPTYPLSFAQERIWFLEQYEPGKPVFIMPLAYELKGRLDIKALRDSVNEIVRRHDTLRTVFIAENGRPLQQVLPSLNIHLPLVNLQDTSQEDREEQISDIREQVFLAPFNLETGPMLRGLLIKITPQKHLFLLAFHHIIADGWSLDVFFRELVALYKAFSADQSSPLPLLTHQYKTHVDRQQQVASGQAFSEKLAFWQDALSGAPMILSLPTDRPRPAIQTYTGQRISFSIESDLSTAIKNLCQAEKVTPFMLLLAAFNLLLERNTGQTDLLVGTPIAGRSEDEVERLIGLFLNVLIIRTRTNEAGSFRELLHQVRQTALSAYEHQDFPIEKLIDELNPVRELSHSPLYQVWFAMQNQPWEGFELPGLTIRQLESYTGTSKVDLSFYIYDSPTGFMGTIEFNADLFDKTTIVRLAGHYEQLLRSAVTNPDHAIETLSMLTPAERKQLLVEWNQTGRSFPILETLPTLFKAQVRQTPQAIAFQAGNQSITYEALNQRANQIAHLLCDNGIGPGAIVGISLSRSIEMVTALLGILKTGAAYLPLDPDYPAKRLTFMATNADLAALVTEEKARQTLAHLSAPIIILDAKPDPLQGQPGTDLTIPAVSPEATAYLIYTSGSTGQPKGVAIPHKQIINRLNWMWREYPFQPGEVGCQRTALNFVDSIWEIFGPLLQGIPTVIIPDEVIQDPAEFVTALGTHKVTRLWLVPSLLRVILDTLPDLAQQLPDLKFWVTSGEPIPMELFRRFQEQMPHATMYNLYGTSEVWDVTWYPPNDELNHLTRVPIGKPIDNMETYILDSKMRPLPIGIPGELYVAGVGLAHGYLGRPSRTALTFVPHPFSQQPGARLNRTGDLARYLPDGNIEFLGRQDFQLKIRGFRVELGEIESILRQHAAVSDTVVTTYQDDIVGKRLVAYIVPNKNTPTPDVDMFRNFLAARLPDYMIPAIFVFLEALPLTPNEKIDRQALPDPERNRAQQSNIYIAPSTPTQELMASIWGQLLNIENVGIDDNFFALGGHSLLATQAISRLRDVLDRPIPLRDIFEFPTIRGLSERLEQEQTKTAPLPPINPVAHDQTLPLSFAQERLWFLDQFEGGESIAFNIPFVLQLDGNLNIQALEKSLAEIIQRHESLRTIFKTVNGRPVQKILPPSENFQLPLTQVTKNEVERQIRAMANQPFNLETGPVIYGHLFQTNEDEYTLLLLMHHIVFDGWSFDIFFRELTALYEAFSNGKPSPLPPLKLQYSDFAYWQRTYQEAAVFEQQLAYWRESLAGTSTVLELPTDRPRPTIQTSNGRHYTFQLPAELTNTIKKISIEEQSTLFMLLLAAFQVLLARYSGQNDFLVGTPIAGRNRADLEDIIGYFLNTLLLRADLSKNPTFREYLRQVRQAALNAYANQDIPVERLIDELNPVRDMSRSPLFQVVFALQNMPSSNFDLPGLTVRQLKGYNETAKIDLSLYIAEQGGGLHGIFEYNSDLFEEATIMRLAEHYEQMLRSAVSNPDRPVKALSILPITERRQLLVNWNNTNRPYPSTETLPTLFETQVGKSPKANAFMMGNQTITYEGLNSRANQIAHLLRSYKIGPGSVVGFSLSRSTEMVAALIGILKTGAAYLPLDPGYPAERLTFMAADAGMAALVTEEAALPTLANLQVPVISLDGKPDPLKYQPNKTPPHVFVSPEAVAYIIYTSGSTGQPKGVKVPHKQIMNRLNWMWREYPFQVGEVGCQRTALNFVDSIWEIFGPLLQGIPTVIVPDEVVQDPADFVAALGIHEISRLWLVPSLLRTLLDTIPDLAQRLPHLKFWVTSGEMIPMELFKRFHDEMPHAVIYNLYGTSEVWDVTWYPPNANHAGQTRVPIGKPIDNMQTYILDEQMRPLPIGVPGELYVAGEGLAQGYLGRPSRTATTFVPHPFSQKPGARLNRTGDLARYLPDGNIEFLGRRDFQVKVRGFRIEPGEVESVLLQHPAVQTAVVVAPELKNSERRLIAYIVSQTKPTPSINELREFLGQTLPDPMIPTLFIFLEEIPLTPNGKVDRAALPEPDSSRPEISEKYVAPRSSAEKVLADIWQEVLDLTKVGVYDNFFELGGHSLLATQVTFKIQEIFQVNFPLHEVFNKPTVAEMVETLIQFWGDQDLVEEIARTWEEIMEMSSEEAVQLLEEVQSSD